MSNFIKDRPDAVTIAPTDRIKFIDVSDTSESLLGTRKDSSIELVLLNNLAASKGIVSSGYIGITTTTTTNPFKLQSLGIPGISI